MPETTYTFLPVVLPNYNVGGPMGIEAPGLGHAGFIAVDADGKGTFYEFGRYDPDKNIKTITRNPLGSTEGNIRQLEIVTPFKFDANGNVDQHSLLSALNEVFGSSKMYSKDTGMVSVTQFDVSQDQLRSIENYIKSESKRINDGQTNYQILGKNCIQFVYDAAKAADLSIGSTQDLPGTSVPSMAFSTIRNEGKATFQYFGPNSWNKNWLKPDDSVLGLSADYLADRLRQFAIGVTKTLENHGILEHEAHTNIQIDPLTKTPVAIELTDNSGRLLQRASLEKNGALKSVEFSALGQRTRDVLLDSNGVVRSLSTFDPSNGRILNSQFFDKNGKVSPFSDVRSNLLDPRPIQQQGNAAQPSTSFTELSEKTRAALLDPNGAAPAASKGPQAINISINPNPKPQTEFQHETQRQRDIANGFLTNRPTHQISFSGKELDETSFASAQMGSIATGGVRPGEIQLDPNPRPNNYLAQNLKSAANLIPGLGPLVGAVNAVVTNGLSASMTKNVFVDPIVLDLSGKGVKLVGVSDGVLFDINHSGTQKRTGWTGAGTGLLVVDAGDGKITNASQLLSEYYGGKEGTNGGPGETPFANGFAALASEDKNGDLVIDQNDPIWSKLKVWVDSNHNGVSDTGELKTLDSLGITQFQLATSRPQAGELRDGNEVLAKGSFTINGRTQEALAVNFIADPVSSTFKNVAGGMEITSSAGAVTKKSYASSSAVGETLDAGKLGVDNLYGGQGDDTLTAAPNGSWLTGGGGSNVYNGSNADDVFVISGSDKTENIHGNGGRDTAIIIGEDAVTLDMAQAGLTIAQGGRGDDVIRSGGQTGVFIKGGSGNQTLIGGGGNDVISGGSGNNIIIGGTGKAVIHAGPNGDLIYASDGGSIVNAGGGDDFLYGRDGDDVFIVGRGNARIDGGGGINVGEFHGSYGDYQISKNGETYTVTDKVHGRDGVISFTNVQKLNFADISGIDLAAGNPLPVADGLRVNKEGKTFDRKQLHLISAEQLLSNDHRLNSVGSLRIKSVSAAAGGGVSLTASGDVLFTPDKDFTGIMSFKYDIEDEAQHSSAQVVDLATGETAPMRAVANLFTSEIPSDPLVGRQWYLSDVNIFPVWKDYTGKGVRIGQFEPGGKFSVGSEIFNLEHPDLSANIDQAWLETERLNKTLPDAKSDHATMVAGVMVAAKNDEGGVGIAYEAKLGGHYLDNGGVDLSGLGKMVSYDIANNSWGFVNDFARSNLQNGQINNNTALLTNTQYAAQNGRGGLGTVIVAAGGNEREAGGSAQGSLTSNNRFVIQVGAINAQSDLSTLQVGAKPFSNPGASLLVSAPGSNVMSTGQLIETEQGSTFGNAYSTLNGTSFATPIVSGIVATMLQANPNLGYRDIQTILALSARKVDDPSTFWSDNATKNWNGGGMHTSHDYGFGKIDALAAVRLAESWMTQAKGDNEFVVSGKSVAPMAVTSGQSVTSFVQLSGGVKIEHVEIDFVAKVGRLGDVTVKLIAPDGTSSILLDRHGKKPNGVAGAGTDDTGSSLSGDFKYTFMTTHSWGERSEGKWALEVTNAENGLPVTVESWGVRAYGAKASVDDSYFFTNEFAGLAASSAERKLLDDSVNGTNGGRNTINAAAVTGDVSVDLNEGKANIGGTELMIKTPASIQNIITGDGDDTLIAGTSDTLLDGQRGTNKLRGGTGKDYFVVHCRADGRDVIAGFEAEKGERIALIGFKGKSFGDLQMKQQGEDTLVDLGAGQSILLTGQSINGINADLFAFQDTFVAPAEYVGDGALPVPTASLGTIILKGGAEGVKYEGQPDGSQQASLAGIVYSRDSAASDTFIIEKQSGVMSYRNALRGFRHGIDKLDLSQLGITSFDDLIIEKVNRATINGLSQIHGVSVKSKSLNSQSAAVELVYLDTLDPAQFTTEDIVFAVPMPGKASVVTKPVTSGSGEPKAPSNPLVVDAAPIPQGIFDPIKIELPSIKFEPPKITIAPIRIEGGPVVLDPGPVSADPFTKSVKNSDGTITKTVIASDGTITEMTGRFDPQETFKSTIRTVVVKPDGTRTELLYDQSAANELESATTTFPDGTKTETVFGNFGKKKSQIATKSDGYRIETLYDGMSDKIVSQTTTKPDGTKVSVSSGVSGRHETVTKPDGSSVEVIFNGDTEQVRSKNSVDINGTKTQVFYNFNTGFVSSESITKSDGSSVSIIWGKDQQTVYATNIDKTSTKKVTDIATGIVRQLLITKPDQSKVESLFDTDGILASQVAIAPDGTKTSLLLVPPVILDLNRDNQSDIQILDSPASTCGSRTKFDWNDDGVADETAWVGPNDGMLVVDLAADGSAGHDGKIDQVKEIAFAFWKTEDERQAELKEKGIDDTGQPVTDLEGLRYAFDSNRDNVLDMRDERWSEFRVWQDKNQNGIAEAGELLTMEQAGIRLIDLMPSKEGSKAFADGSAITGTSQAQMTDGTRMLVGDVTLAYRPSLTA